MLRRVQKLSRRPLIASEPGGLGWYDMMALATALANGPGIIGMDVSEMAPISGFAAPQFTIARLIYRILGKVLAGRRL